jgi:hypothetical protein
MFAKSGKKEVWIGMCHDGPAIEISWGKLNEHGDPRRRVKIPFEEFIAEELNMNEKGGPGSKGHYDEEVIDLFDDMIRVLDCAREVVMRRNGES